MTKSKFEERLEFERAVHEFAAFVEKHFQVCNKDDCVLTIHSRLDALVARSKTLVTR